MDSTPLLIPLTSPGSLNFDAHVLPNSVSTSQPTILKFWESRPGADVPEATIGGVVLGCEDGTLYIFSPARTPPLPPKCVLPERPESTPLLRSNSRTPSRSSTPSASSSVPFNLTTRSRVVSGITKEQVEAPKNFVDFEEEPDKLKDMLEGRHPRDSQRSMPSDADGNEGRSPPPHLSTGSKSPSTLHSLNRSSSPFVASTPSPRHPSLSIANTELTLLCRVVPPYCGPRHAVRAMCILQDYLAIAVLQESGDLTLFSLDDGSYLTSVHAESSNCQLSLGAKTDDDLNASWSWCHLSLHQLGESIVLATSASLDPSSWTSQNLDLENSEVQKTRTALFECHINHTSPPFESSLINLGQFLRDGPPHCFEIDDDLSTIFYLTCENSLVARSIDILPRLLLSPENHAESHPPGIGSLTFPHPFRAKTNLLQQPSFPENDRLKLGEEQTLARLPISTKAGLHLSCQRTGDAVLGLVWSQMYLLILQKIANDVHVLCARPSDDIRHVAWLGDNKYIIVYKDHAEIGNIPYIVDERNSAAEPRPSANKTSEPGQVQCPTRRLQTIHLDHMDVLDVQHTYAFIYAPATEQGMHQIHQITRVDLETGAAHRMWSASPVQALSGAKRSTTALLPVSLDNIVEGYEDGHLGQSSFLRFCNGTNQSLPSKVSDHPLNGHIISLHEVQNPRTKERYIVGGGDDGSIAFWTADRFLLCARWTMFITPLLTVAQVQESLESPLRGCMLCISVDGTIAVIAVDGFQFLYLIPGAAAPLSKIYFSGANLLIVYFGNRARQWDVLTKEFRRSMSLDKVQEALSQGVWSEISLADRRASRTAIISRIQGPIFGRTIAPTLILNLNRFTSDFTAAAKTISTNRDQTRAILLSLERVRAALSTLLTFGLNDEIDAVVVNKLGIKPASTTAGFFQQEAMTLYNYAQPQAAWCISGDVSAARAISITMLLAALGLFEEHLEAVNTVTTFYATSISFCLGPFYQRPSLVYIARRWFAGSSEERQAAQTVFDYIVPCLAEEEVNTITEGWQHYLPCLQPPAEREWGSSALALFICGRVAAEKYSLLPTSLLTDISKSLGLYLHDEQSVHRVLAIDLCSRGFHIWKHYIDAMEILRALFSLATTSRKDSISLQNVGTQARLAVLHIATNDTPLFMATLGLDILSPQSIEHRRSVLQIMAFLIRKRPLILQPNIPKLMEAVVKSLNPNVTTDRDAIIDTATEIIGFVVRTFPSVDFHMQTQRLAVGSNEGAIVMYDLKTATRLYVLEGHKKRITACSFSADGRRLVSLSLEENTVLVWKVGTSFASFFTPGVPPRQGHSGSQPYKTLNFNIGNDAQLSVAETLSLVRIEWTGDRSVKVKIRDSVLSLST